MQFTFIEQPNPQLTVDVYLHGYFGDADIYDNTTLNFDFNHMRYDTALSTTLDELFTALFESCDALCTVNHSNYSAETIPHWERFEWVENLPHIYEYFEQIMNVNDYRITYYDEVGNRFIVKKDK